MRHAQLRPVFANTKPGASRCLRSLTSAFLTYPNIDPVIVSWGPIAIRWYSLAYILGLILGWAYMRLLIREKNPICRGIDVDDFVLWAMIGIVLGGRIGYVLFYNFDFYMAHPAEALRVWDGGMSFHGGLVGTSIAMIWFTRRRGIPLLKFTDRISCVVPIGLGLGRIANFINGELYGRVTDVPWAMVFPHGGPFRATRASCTRQRLKGLSCSPCCRFFFISPGFGSGPARSPGSS